MRPVTLPLRSRWGRGCRPTPTGSRALIVRVRERRPAMGRPMKSVVVIVAVALMSWAWPPRPAAAPDPCACPNPTDKVVSPPADTTADITNPATPDFIARARAITVFNACDAVSKPTPDPATLSAGDFGEGFDVRLF